MTHVPPRRRSTSTGGHPLGRRAAALLAALALLLSTSGAALAEGLPVADQRKIDALIAHIEHLSEAQFVRNGRTYDARTAATFLHRKWESRRDLVKSAEDFIQHVASASSTSGQPYLIRFPDGRDVPCGDYLRAELRRLAP